MDKASRDSKVAWLVSEIDQQKRWIERCGGDLAGYVANYGSRDDEKHSGDGGEAIYAADAEHLVKLEAHLTRLGGPGDARPAQETAFEGKRTSGPWGLRGVQIRADGGRGRHVATYQINAADGYLIAAAPELLDMLREACDSLDACERASATHVTADHIRERLAALLIREGA